MHYTALIRTQQHRLRQGGIFIALVAILLLTTLLVDSSYWLHTHSIAQTTEDIDLEINDLNTSIDAKKQEIAEIDKKINQYRSEIAEKRKQATTLRGQLEILEEQQKATELEINKLQIRVNQTELEIKANTKEITKLQELQQKTKQHIAEFIRELDKTDDKSYLEIILLNNSISDFITAINHLTNVEEDLQGTLDSLILVSERLEIEQKNLITRRTNLNGIKQKLEEERGKLEAQITAQEQLLAQTQSSERQYQSLLSQQRSLQNNINSEIVALEKSLRKKLEDQKHLGSLGSQRLWWPVPSRYITAGFHDNDYPFRHVFEHPAIDIRASQGTPVRAASSGYVARAKDAGLGYSYIMLIHADGFSTVYGHISQIMVKEDTYVQQGDVIALSGGTPGTAGAGKLTTGPHLHFEVRKNGIPMNPVPFLPSAVND